MDSRYFAWIAFGEPAMSNVLRNIPSVNELLDRPAFCFTAQPVAPRLDGLIKYYQSRYPGAMYSGCGGGYLYVVSEQPVPGAFGVSVRIAKGRNQM